MFFLFKDAKKTIITTLTQILSTETKTSYTAHQHPIPKQQTHLAERRSQSYFVVKNSPMDFLSQSRLTMPCSMSLASPVKTNGQQNRK